jgi:hypothetical protein
VRSRVRLAVGFEQSQQRRRPASRDFRSARRSDSPDLDDPADCRAAFVATHGPVGAYSKSTVQQTSGAVAIAQNEQRVRRMRRGCSLGKAAITTSADDVARVTAPGHNQPRHHARDTRADVKASLGPRVATHLLVASCALIASPGSLPRNQKTAGFSRLSSFASQAGLVEPACTCADRRGCRTCAGAVLADLELTQVRRVAPVGPARSARRARPSLGSGWLLFCRSSAAQPRFGLADRRSSRAGHERRHASSTAATCERTSARA